MTSLGSLFRTRREQRGCTLDDIAARTKIPRRLLVDLERNTFARWPASRVYRIGYLRAYAAAIGLDATEVIAQFDAENGSPPPASVAAHDDHWRFARRERRPVVSLTLALAGSTALLLGLSFFFEPALPIAAQSGAGPRDISLEPASVETTPVPTSGGPLEPDDVEGELLIDSEPAGTHVSVNGIGRGTTPIRLQYLPIGSYTIRLVRDGYESKEATTTITSDTLARSISLTLSKRP
jgi:transcriptional regulator with XRE-family HTH domain